MRKALIILGVLFGVFLAIGCVENELVTPTERQNATEMQNATERQNATEMQNSTEMQNATEMQNVTEETELKEYTLEELAEYNGSNGKIYVAYQGQVYDVSSDSYLWKDGDHEGCGAGKDITEEMDRTPHGSELLKDYPVVGTLKK